jgi:Kelch motif
MAQTSGSVAPCRFAVMAGVTLGTALAGAGCNVDLDVPDVESAIAEGGVSVAVTYEMHLERFDSTSGQFVVLAPPPTQRNLFDVETVNGKVVVLGGLDGVGDYVSAVEVYDPVAAAWTSRAAWPHPHSAYFAAIGDLVCAFAGTRGLNLTPVLDVDCYDVVADAWSARMPVPEDLGVIYPVVLGSDIYLLGGAHLDAQNLATPHAKAYAYDPDADLWTPLAALPGPRGLAAVVTTGGSIYVVGGIGAPVVGTTGPSDTTMLVYDPVGNTWSNAPQMPTARILGFGVDAIGQSGELATYFGIGGPPTLDRYDATTNSWRSGTEPPQPLSPGVYSSLTMAGNIYVLDLADAIDSGGTSSSGKLWEYDAAGDAWSVVGQRTADTRTALFFGVPIAGSIYFAGAFTNATVSP